MARLLPSLQRPRTAVDCLETIYGRRLLPQEYGDRLGEAMGYLNHLHQSGRVERVLDRAGAYQWRVLNAVPAATPRSVGLRPLALG